MVGAFEAVVEEWGSLECGTEAWHLSAVELGKFGKLYTAHIVQCYIPIGLYLMRYLDRSSTL